MKKEDAKDFKDIIERIIEALFDRKGVTKYIAAVVESVNEDGTINVYIPPDKAIKATKLLNKTGQSLQVGDSVDLCTKNGKISNAWVAIKHKDNFVVDDLIVNGEATNPNKQAYSVTYTIKKLETYTPKNLYYYILEMDIHTTSADNNNSVTTDTIPYPDGLTKDNIVPITFGAGGVRYNYGYMGLNYGYNVSNTTLANNNGSYGRDIMLNEDGIKISVFRGTTSTEDINYHIRIFFIGYDEKLAHQTYNVVSKKWE